ncbi:MAG: 50S ribosomal protein L4 [SAR202 cluster bacterium]|nr:MAG: 50S ribosomal protein L4 [SAR202 cluster bacterium]MEC8987312.1 50S ribosomal protein L4 [Chloroflexota bacterium]MED5409530.1 50S ribosomal protein L4 [Chloroflexota bacterium]
MKLEIKNTQGENAGDLDVREDVFNVPIKPALVHQVMVGQLANKRQGTAKTKTRSEVSGGGAKPRPQKHTGSSRQGSTRSPIWVGGGRAFGPTPRSYRKRTPKKMRRLALLSVLSDKARQSNVLLLDSLELKEGKTKEIVSILSALNVSGSALIVTDGTNKKLVQSAGNVGGVRTLPVQVLNTLDLLNRKQLIITVDAVKRIEEIWGGIYKGDLGSSVTPVEDNEVVKEIPEEQQIAEGSKESEDGSEKPTISDLGLSTRTNNLLIQAEITDMNDLTNLSKSELLNISGFGEKSYLEVREKLENLNILPSDWD